MEEDALRPEEVNDDELNDDMEVVHAMMRTMKRDSHLMYTNKDDLSRLLLKRQGGKRNVSHRGKRMSSDDSDVDHEKSDVSIKGKGVNGEKPDISLSEEDVEAGGNNSVSMHDDIVMMGDDAVSASFLETVRNNREYLRQRYIVHQISSWDRKRKEREKIRLYNAGRFSSCLHRNAQSSEHYNHANYSASTMRYRGLQTHLT